MATLTRKGGAMKLLLVSVITLLRVPLSLASVYCMLQQQWVAAWVLFLLCAATDVVDGQLARYWAVVTPFGVKADLWSDILIYWIFVPCAYWYSQLYSPWWRLHLPPGTFAGFLLVGAVLVVHFTVATTPGKRFAAWYKAKGNFWFGVTQVAAVGCWISWHAGPMMLAVTVAYGLLACVINRTKLLSKL